MKFQPPILVQTSFTSSLVPLKPFPTAARFVEALDPGALVHVLQARQIISQRGLIDSSTLLCRFQLIELGAVRVFRIDDRALSRCQTRLGHEEAGVTFADQLPV